MHGPSNSKNGNCIIIIQCVYIVGK
jgi:hypothetical protein